MNTVLNDELASIIQGNIKIVVKGLVKNLAWIHFTVAPLFIVQTQMAIANCSVAEMVTVDLIPIAFMRFYAVFNIFVVQSGSVPSHLSKS